MAIANENLLGTFLRDRREKLDPAAFGISAKRRRTPGLRREEVAQRAYVSATWYTWLEQGRGGSPSADVLDRIAQALTLSPVEREHLYLLALGRPPGSRYQPCEGVSPKLQRVLDSLTLSPAYVKTAAWDVLAWNTAAAAVLTDYGAIPVEQRNVLRKIFSDERCRDQMSNWHREARFAVAAFRAESTRAGASERAHALVEELSRTSPEFAAIWNEQDVRMFAEGSKQISRDPVGLIGLEYSSFAVEGRPDLGMVVFTPATPEDAEKIKVLITAHRAAC